MITNEAMECSLALIAVFKRIYTFVDVVFSLSVADTRTHAYNLADAHAHICTNHAYLQPAWPAAVVFTATEGKVGASTQ